SRRATVPERPLCRLCDRAASTTLKGRARAAEFRQAETACIFRERARLSNPAAEYEHVAVSHRTGHDCHAIVPLLQYCPSRRITCPHLVDEGDDDPRGL